MLLRTLSEGLLKSSNINVNKVSLVSIQRLTLSFTFCTHCVLRFVFAQLATSVSALCPSYVIISGWLNVVLFDDNIAVMI